VRYLAQTSPYRIESREPFESRYPTIYFSGGEFNFRVLDLGDPATRPSWMD
jgi:hypothetical protein